MFIVNQQCWQLCHSETKVDTIPSTEYCEWPCQRENRALEGLTLTIQCFAQKWHVLLMLRNIWLELFTTSHSPSDGAGSEFLFWGIKAGELKTFDERPSCKLYVFCDANRCKDHMENIKILMEYGQHRCHIETFVWSWEFSNPGA